MDARGFVPVVRGFCLGFSVVSDVRILKVVTYMHRRHRTDNNRAGMARPPRALFLARPASCSLGCVEVPTEHAILEPSAAYVRQAVNSIRSIDLAVH